MARKAPLISRKQALTAMGALSTLQAMVIAGDASAGVATSTLFINASVVANCLIDNATMNFSTFTVLSGSAAAPVYNTVNATASIPYACTNAWPGSVWVAANNVTLSGSGANTLLAKLYADAGNSTAYPTAAVTGVAVNGSGSAATTPIYGVIATDPTTKADAYTGSTQLTITY